MNETDCLIIFACVHNAGRSQMAAAYFNQLADSSKARAISAGTQPAEKVHDVVVEIMHEVGIDLSNNKPQLLTDQLAANAKMLVTMGCQESCPVVPGLKRLDWPLADPKGQTPQEVRKTREEIKTRIVALIHELNAVK